MSHSVVALNFDVCLGGRWFVFHPKERVSRGSLIEFLAGAAKQIEEAKCNASVHFIENCKGKLHPDVIYVAQPISAI